MPGTDPAPDMEPTPYPTDAGNELSGLEHELISVMRDGNKGVREDLSGLRDDMKTIGPAIGGAVSAAMNKALIVLLFAFVVLAAITFALLGNGVKVKGLGIELESDPPSARIPGERDNSLRACPLLLLGAGKASELCQSAIPQVRRAFRSAAVSVARFLGKALDLGVLGLGNANVDTSVAGLDIGIRCLHVRTVPSPLAIV